MIEKFADYDGVKYLNKTGDFVFKVLDYELKESRTGTPMAVFTVQCDEGQTTIYHSLSPKAKWTYNELIAACLKLTAQERRALELDYETFGQNLVGKSFVATVVEDSYEKITKVLNDEGTYDEVSETKTSYKIDTTSYAPAN